MGLTKGVPINTPLSLPPSACAGCGRVSSGTEGGAVAGEGLRDGSNEVLSPKSSVVVVGCGDAEGVQGDGWELPSLCRVLGASAAAMLLIACAYCSSLTGGCAGVGECWGSGFVVLEVGRAEEAVGMMEVVGGGRETAAGVGESLGDGLGVLSWVVAGRVDGDRRDARLRTMPVIRV